MKRRYSDRLIFRVVMLLLILVGCIVAAYISVNINNSIILNEYRTTIDKYNFLNEYYEDFNTAHQYVNNYIVDKSEDTKNDYTVKIEEMHGNIDRIMQHEDSEGLPMSLGTFIDLDRLTTTYSETVERMMDAVDRNDYKKANEENKNATRLYNLATDKMNSEYIALNKYANMKLAGMYVSSNNLFDVLSVIIFVAVLAISVIVIWYIISKIVKPINSISGKAKEISRGNLDVEFKSDSNIFEIDDLNKSFKKMIADITKKSELEKRLIEEENEKLRYINEENKLKLAALESKINPHFLFNTLNMIGNLAYMENAAETRSSIEVTSRILRNYLYKSSANLSIKDEIENINDYMYIQNKRFGDRISYEVEADESILDALIPNMCVQPLVENAIKHGFDMDQKGKVLLRFQRGEDGKSIEIDVCDNGRGIPYRDINEIKESKHDRIGLRNIYDRLCILYKREDLVIINSDDEYKTIITIIIPETGEEQS